MMTLLYILLFLAWVAAALFLGRFVRSAGIGSDGSFFSGIRIMFAFYLLGVGLLFLAILLS